MTPCHSQEQVGQGIVVQLSKKQQSWYHAVFQVRVLKDISMGGGLVLAHA